MLRVVSSPLGLRSFDDVVDDLLDREAASVGIGALGVITFAAESLATEKHLALLDVEDFNVHRDLQPSPRGGRGGAEADRNVLLILQNGSAHDRLRPVLRSFANAKSAAELDAHLFQ